MCRCDDFRRGRPVFREVVWLYRAVLLLAVSRQAALTQIRVSMCAGRAVRHSVGLRSFPLRPRQKSSCLFRFCHRLMVASLLPFQLFLAYRLISASANLLLPPAIIRLRPHRDLQNNFIDVLQLRKQNLWCAKLLDNLLSLEPFTWYLLKSGPGLGSRS